MLSDPVALQCVCQLLDDGGDGGCSVRVYAADGLLGQCQASLQPWLAWAHTSDCGKHLIEGILVPVV